MREEKGGEHLAVACTLALATVLVNLNLVVALVHAKQALSVNAAVVILGRGLNSKLQGVTSGSGMNFLIFHDLANVGRLSRTAGRRGRVWRAV